MERQKAYEKYIVPLMRTMEQFLQQADIPYVLAFAPDGLEHVESAVVAHASLPPEGSGGMVFVVTFDAEKQAHTVDIMIMPGDADVGDMSIVVGDIHAESGATFGGRAVRFDADGTLVESGE